MRTASFSHIYPSVVARETCREHGGAVLLVCLLLAATAWPNVGRTGAAETQDPSLLTIDRIFDANEFETKSWGPARWLKDQSRYATLEDANGFEKAKDVVCYDPQTGQREVVLTAARLIPPGREKPLKIDNYAWSDDGKKLLIFTNTKRVWRRNTRGDYWVLDTSDGTLTKLGGKADPSRMMFAKFSPDGKHVAHVYRNNIYVQDLQNLRVRQLTKDGSDLIINGTGDWVNEEELSIRDGFRWSPDGRFIAYWQFNTEQVKEFTLINYTKDLYPTLKSFKYPKVGQVNSACRVGVVSASGGRTRWLKIPGDPREHYIHSLEWRPDSSDIVVGRLNRLQNTNRIFIATVRKGLLGGLRIDGPRLVFTDTDEAWVRAGDIPAWLNEGREFLYLSERDGWQHLYRVSRATGEAHLLSTGDYDVIRVLRVDKDRRHIYIIASPDNPTQRYLYRLGLNGGQPERVTPIDQPGMHSYQISEDANWAFHTYSSFGRPPVTALIRLPEHALVRTLEDNTKLRENLDALKPWHSELFRIDVNGVAIDGWCIKPPGFDPDKRYPLFIYVYGEPAGQTVLDKWGGEKSLWHAMLAQQGYVVASMDNRGTPAPRGRAWRKSVYRQIGILASADQAAATRKLIEQWPYVDPNRIGVWGWSGGGSMTLNAMFRYPDLYKVGMAIAFVANQRFYDTIYQERYMGLVADNEEGYTKGSPITFAEQLKGDLLLVYGSGDDNCHYQNCQVLVNKLIEHNKQFSMMIYPNRTHSIKEGKNTKRHLYETLTRYLKEHLTPGSTP